MSNIKILVIDDEEAILKLVTSYLRPEGYEIFTAKDGASGLQAFRAFKPNLVVLDVMLPGIDGIELLSRIRRESDVYVIMLTAKSEETDKIVGLSIGADDYVTKPFSPRELVARIKAAVRRMGNGRGLNGVGMLVFEHIRIDTGRRQVWVDDRLIELTTTEFDLIKSLAEHRGLVLSREQLLEDVWGHEYYGELRVVDVHIGHIRQKIGEQYIATVRGVGYRFVDEVG
jgi:two-component system alkaline phosphatase synthesis response regulator PhoP